MISNLLPGGYYPTPKEFIMQKLQGRLNKNQEEIYAELFGIFISKNTITEKGINFTTENVSLAKRVYSNLKSVINTDIFFLS